MYKFFVNHQNMSSTAPPLPSTATASAVAVSDNAEAVADTGKKSVEKTSVAGEHCDEEHPFFHYYGLLVHQQNMWVYFYKNILLFQSIRTVKLQWLFSRHRLQDTVRTGTYRDAIINNTSDFTEAVVVDVGAGTGILSFFAAQVLHY